VAFVSRVYQTPATTMPLLQQPRRELWFVALIFFNANAVRLAMIAKNQKRILATFAATENRCAFWLLVGVCKFPCFFRLN
jgi:hypothetical protein